MQSKNLIYSNTIKIMSKLERVTVRARSTGCRTLQVVRNHPAGVKSRSCADFVLEAIAKKFGRAYAHRQRRPPLG